MHWNWFGLLLWLLLSLIARCDTWFAYLLYLVCFGLLLLAVFNSVAFVFILVGC